MKKLLPVLAILAVIGAGWFLFKSKKGGVPGINKTYTAKGLKAIIDLGIPVKCSYQVGNMEYEGYVKGKQWRGKMQYPDGRKGEIIMKNDCMWSWSNDDNKGIKMCLEPTDDDQDMWDNPENTNPDLDYLCRPAAVTDAQFEPPADIQFMDLNDVNQMMDPANFNPQNENTDSYNYQMPENLDMSDVPDSAEDFDMSRYQE